MCARLKPIRMTRFLCLLEPPAPKSNPVPEAEAVRESFIWNRKQLLNFSISDRKLFMILLCETAILFCSSLMLLWKLMDVSWFFQLNSKDGTGQDSFYLQKQLWFFQQNNHMDAADCSSWLFHLEEWMLMHSFILSTGKEITIGHWLLLL